MNHVKTYESFLNEAKMGLNKRIPTSTKKWTWIYQTGKDSDTRKTIAEINKKLNAIGIHSYVVGTDMDAESIAIPTKDMRTAFDKVLSDYDNLKQFAYSDGTKLDKTIVNESFLNEASSKYTVADFPIGAKVFMDDEVWIVVKPGARGNKVFMAPFNKEAKDRYVSIAIEHDINFLNGAVHDIEI